MPLSVFDLFKIGIGPSSSHTVGPMWAAHRFGLLLETDGRLARTGRVRVDLFGSLALTGKGHATDKAIILGLAGEVPDRIDPDAADARLEELRQSGRLDLMGRQSVAFDETTDLVFNFAEILPKHPNGMRFRAFDVDGAPCGEEIYYSVGGGFVLSDAEADAGHADSSNVELPFPFHSADELVALCDAQNMSIAELVRANELSMRDAVELDEGLDRLWQIMEACIERGCRTPGTLPGGLKVRRRAAKMYEELTRRPEAGLRDQLTVIDWVNLYALAVNEENAAGGRVVTAPTNGAAGVIPAVLAYYERFVPGSSKAGIRTFLLTASAIGMLYKENASISAAEVGCQGEVGVALLDGRRCPLRRARRHHPASGECRRDRHGAQSRPDLRSHWRACADPVHRAQHHGCGQGDQRRPPRLARRRHPSCQSRQGHLHHARDGSGHVGKIQGNVLGRPRRQSRGVLDHGKCRPRIDL